MLRRVGLFILLITLTLLVLAQPVSACPNCGRSMQSVLDEETDLSAEARAYNRSIYLMIAVPYLLVGTVGYLVYRGLRKKAQLEQSPSTQPTSPRQGDGPCSTPSTEDDFSPAP